MAALIFIRYLVIFGAIGTILASLVSAILWLAGRIHWSRPVLFFIIFIALVIILLVWRSSAPLVGRDYT